VIVEPSEDVDGGAWQTVCDEHSSVVCHDTLRAARSWAAAPDEWCEDCRVIIEARKPTLRDQIRSQLVSRIDRQISINNQFDSQFFSQLYDQFGNTFETIYAMQLQYQLRATIWNAVALPPLNDGQ
jgi:predicted TPR repeat methyltransferase